MLKSICITFDLISKGEIHIVDDALVDIRVSDEYGKRPKNVFEFCLQQGICINPEKFEHRVTTAAFHRYILLNNWLMAHPEMVRLIANMLTPRAHPIHSKGVL